MTVYEKLANVQAELKAPKSQYNKFGKYYYRNCEDILEAVKPIAAKNKALVIVGDTLEIIGNRFYIKATAVFVDTSTGEKVEENAYAREEETKKGMDASQVTGSTSSYARKYALNGLLCIDDTKDADSQDNKNTDKQAVPGDEQNSAPSAEAGEETVPSIIPATLAQLHKLNEFVDAYAEMLEGKSATDIWNLLKERYHFKSTGEISQEVADKLIKQVETWYKKQKEK